MTTGKVFAIISGKGGVGKTTTAINLGFSINALGKEVVIVDANLTTPNVGLHLGSPIVPITLNHVIKGEAKPEEAIYEHETGAKIMLSSLSVGELKDLNHDKIVDVAKKLRKIADNIVLDSPAGLGDEAKAALKSADSIIIVTNPEISAVTDALKTIKLAEEMGKDIEGVIITRHTGEKWEMSVDSIRDMLEVPILGVVPEDNSVKESQVMKNPVIHTHPKSKAAKSYKKITGKIMDIPSEKQKTSKDLGFFSKLWAKLTNKE